MLFPTFILFHIYMDVGRHLCRSMEFWPFNINWSSSNCREVQWDCVRSEGQVTRACKRDCGPWSVQVNWWAAVPDSKLSLLQSKFHTERWRTQWGGNNNCIKSHLKHFWQVNLGTNQKAVNHLRTLKLWLYPETCVSITTWLTNSLSNQLKSQLNWG